MNKRSVIVIHVRIFRETRFRDVELLFPTAFDLDWQQRESGEIRHKFYEACPRRVPSVKVLLKLCFGSFTFVFFCAKESLARKDTRTVKHKTESRWPTLPREITFANRRN